MGLYWKLMPNKTLVSSREKEAKGFKKPKDRVTLLACANATGSIKLPLVFIHKSKNPSCFKHIDKNDLPIDYYAPKNSWMDATIFTQWFKQSFRHIVVEHLKTKVLRKGLFSSFTMPHRTQMLTCYSQMMGRYPAFTYPQTPLL